MIAVASGILTGIIDSTIVGEWNFAEAKKDAHKDINSKVVNFAKNNRIIFHGLKKEEKIQID